MSYNRVCLYGNGYKDCESLVNAPKEMPNGVTDCEQMFRVVIL